MITNTITLVEKDNVLALFGYVGTPTTTRVLPLLKHYRDRDILLLFPFTGAEPLREPPYDTYIFNLRGSSFQETRELVENFLAIGRNRIGVFYQIDAYGRSGWDGVRRALKSHGLKIVSEATYIRGATFEENMLKQVEILRSGRPDAIISIGSYNACAAFIRDARKTGWQVPIANLSFVNSRRMLEILISGGHGSPLFTTNLVNSQVMPSYDDLSLPAIREYMADMLRSRRTLPENIAPGAAPAKISLGRISLEGYLNAKVLCMALEKMNNPLDRSQLREALSSLTDIDIGINHPIHYTDTDHQGFKHIYFTTIQDGTDVPMTQGDWNSMRK